jgi:hypothetical protein
MPGLLHHSSQKIPQIDLNQDICVRHVHSCTVLPGSRTYTNKHYRVDWDVGKLPLQASNARHGTNA